ncbi:FAD/NAD-P-binding domain-containing protein [Roridomyces roridus]|uniref:FAD/NAD-P-binding domain-containing protein n=1 Tax=Roridomyces roridus TaxID=1738132 RepID=A0AAD7CE31_9AGAR|nr:FAD/NAD-P-binding domain-containing protein [Roridomyces roridus]
MAILKNIVVVGGSYCSTYVIDALAPRVHKTHHTIMIEKNSHMQHIFAFPRISCVPGFEHKAFVPFTDAFHETPRHSTSILQGIVTEVHPDRVVLASGEEIPYEYLIMATGTGKPPLETTTKVGSVEQVNELQNRIKESEDIVIIGGGAYGIQLAFDTKEFYPSKNVTLVHSRTQLLNRFHPKLHEIVSQRAAKIGLKLVLGQRVKIPPAGFPTSGPSYTVELADGTHLPADVAVCCMGSIPLSSPLLTLSPTSIDSQGYIRVTPTLQLADPAFPRVFALGDVAATGANKAAAPGYVQASILTENIVNMIEGRSERLEFTPSTNGIHLAIGLHSYVTFYDPAAPGEEPKFQFVELGEDESDPEVKRWYECRCHLIWERRAPGNEDYYS